MQLQFEGGDYLRVASDRGSMVPQSWFSKEGGMLSEF